MSLRRALPALLPLALAAAACAPAAAPSATIAATEPPAPTPTREPTGAPTAEPIIVTDALDREVVFDRLPRRIVIAGRASPLLADAIFLFPEAAERIVAVEARAQNVANFLPLVDPGYAEKAALERDASAEQILPFEPDLVIMKTFMADSLGDPLTELGIPVVYLEMETPEQYARDLRSLGQVFGNPERAEQLVGYYQDQTDEVRQLTASAAGDAPPNILLMQYQVESGEVSVEVPSVSWLQTQLAEMVNAEPVWREAAAGGGWTIVGFEQIAAWDPDQIYVVDYFGDSTEAVAALTEDPNWGALRAVQEGQIYGFPADYLSWDQPDPRWILGLQWLATKVHPDVSEEIAIMARLETFFVELYGLAPSTVEEEVVPQLSGDLQ